MCRREARGEFGIAWKWMLGCSTSISGMHANVNKAVPDGVGADGSASVRPPHPTRAARARVRARDQRNTTGTMQDEDHLGVP